MKRPPQLRLVKGYKVMSQDLPPPSEFEGVVARFLLARTAVSQKTLIQYRRVLAAYRNLSPAWPPTPESVAAFIQHCKERYEPGTLHTYYSVVRNFIRFAVGRGFIPVDPLAEISSPRRPGSLPRSPLLDNLKALTLYLEREVERVISARQKPYEWWGWREVRNLALFSLMLDSGLRVNEAANVGLIDVNLESWSVFVRRGKGVKQREVPLGRTSRADVRFWLEYRALIPIGQGEPGRDSLFISHRRGWVQMAPAHVQRTLTKICREAGISPEITPHQLRHAFASVSHDNGLPIGRIQQILGHSEPGTTLRYLLTREGLREHLKSSPRDHQL